MKILIAASIYPPDPGGPAIHAKKQYEWFKLHGTKVEVVILSQFMFLPKVVRHLIFFLNLLAKGWRYDVIYAHDAVGTGIPAFLAARALGKKMIVRVGGDLAWERVAQEGGSKSMLEWYESGEHLNNSIFRLSRWLLSRADHIILPSDLLRNLYKKYFDISGDKMTVIPNPIPDRHNFQFPTEQLIFFASRLVSYKNLDLTIKAFKKVLETHPDLRFIIAGDGPEKRNLENLTKKLGLSNSVQFTGSISQERVNDFTAKCLFTIAPALTEFNPNYVLQGISCGKPFLISKEQGMPFDIPNFLTFSSRDQNDLESKMSHLLMPEGYEQAKHFIGGVQGLTWDDNLQKNLSVIESLWTKRA